ncbi:MAG: glycine/betaine ABC transporter substrate-binding protein [Cyanobacteria bacterium REEB65]|nr:glycine/betaine ABC transporter substrate-binding protein [Cyanobacteria bacterium REEB65]
MRRIVVCLGLALALATTGCLRNPEVLVIGSKAFTEGAILGYLEYWLLRDAGIPVEDRMEMGPTLIVRQALLSGEIDTSFEYTGTALVNFFHEQDRAVLASPSRGLAAIDRLESPKLVWLRPWALNNTYTVLMARRRAMQLHIRTISDLARYRGPVVLGTDPEFAARADGLPGLEAWYGLHPEVRQLDAGLLYEALRKGLLDAAIGYSTDGRIAAFGLLRLADDRQYFPAYHPAPVFRRAALRRFPQAAAILDRVGPSVTDDQITQLNDAVDVQHARPKTVAREWLEWRGLLNAKHR